MSNMYGKRLNKPAICRFLIVEWSTLNINFQGKPCLNFELKHEKTHHLEDYHKDVNFRNDDKTGKKGSLS